MKASKRRELEALTGIRAIAAWWVLLYHLNPELIALFPVAEPVLEFVGAGGFLGVDLFFILSGFIISYNYYSKFQSPNLSTYLHFLWKRLARMYPVHLSTLTAILFLVTLAGSFGVSISQAENYTKIDLLENLLLIHAWNIPLQSSWNAPSWSISAEWLAYLAFPLVAFVLASIKSTKRALLGIGGLLVVMGLICSSLSFATTSAYGLIRIIAEFVAGGLLFRLYQLNWAKGLSWDMISSSALLGVLAYVPIAQQFNLSEFWAAPLFGLVIYGLSFERGRLADILGHSAMVFHGKLSYSLYMTHFICLLVMRKLLAASEFANAGIIPRLAVAAIYLIIIFGVAALTYFGIEEPSRKLMQRSSARLSWFRKAAWNSR